MYFGKTKCKQKGPDRTALLETVSVSNDYYIDKQIPPWYREHSGSVVECLTRDRGAGGLSLTGVTGLCSWARHITGQTQEDPFLHNWKIVDGT